MLTEMREIISNMITGSVIYVGHTEFGTFKCKDIRCLTISRFYELGGIVC